MRILLLLFLSSTMTYGCMTQKELARKSVYSFSIEKNQYQITSINMESGEGTNFISLVDDRGASIMKARDLNQDGSLDLVLKGPWSLFEANLIYTEGIALAKAEGNFKERTSLRTFEFQTSDNLFTIKSYFTGSENVSNLFIIFDKVSESESIFLDSNADGKLNLIEKGSMELEKADVLYKEILDEGIRRDQVHLKNGIYTVRKASELLSYINK